MRRQLEMECKELAPQRAGFDEHIGALAYELSKLANLLGKALPFPPTCFAEPAIQILPYLYGAHSGELLAQYFRLCLLSRRAALSASSAVQVVDQTTFQRH